jgi:hypothetical protein
MDTRDVTPDKQTLRQAGSSPFAVAVITVVDPTTQEIYSFYSARTVADWALFYEMRGYEIARISQEYVELTGEDDVTILVSRGRNSG